MGVVNDKKERVVREYSISLDGVSGTLSVGEENVFVKSGEKSKAIKKNYVVGITKTGDCALNKVEANLEFYDIFGSKNSMKLVMRENDFKALKQTLKK